MLYNKLDVRGKFGEEYKWPNCNKLSRIWQEYLQLHENEIGIDFNIIYISIWYKIMNDPREQPKIDRYYGDMVLEIYIVHSMDGQKTQ